VGLSGEPLRAYNLHIQVARDVILRGAGLAQLWINGLVLFAMGTALLLAAKRFSQMTV
jgi:hypothetical protein